MTVLDKTRPRHRVPDASGAISYSDFDQTAGHQTAWISFETLLDTAGASGVPDLSFNDGRDLALSRVPKESGELRAATPRPGKPAGEASRRADEVRKDRDEARKVADAARRWEAIKELFTFMESHPLPQSSREDIADEIREMLEARQ